MSIKIGNNDISDVKLGNTQVNSIYLGSTKVWEKSNIPNFYNLENCNQLTYSASSGAINLKGVNITDFNNLSNIKVHWCFYKGSGGLNPVDENDKFIFPYKKGSSSSASNSKIGIGSMRADSSYTPTSGSAVYGLTLQNETDLSSYKWTDPYYGTYYYGNFTINPGSSTTLINKGIGLIQLESLYPIAGGSIITPSTVECYETGGDMVINGEFIQNMEFKVATAMLYIDEQHGYEIRFAIEKVS